MDQNKTHSKWKQRLSASPIPFSSALKTVCLCLFGLREHVRVHSCPCGARKRHTEHQKRKDLQTFTHRACLLLQGRLRNRTLHYTRGRGEEHKLHGVRPHCHLAVASGGSPLAFSPCMNNGKAQSVGGKKRQITSLACRSLEMSW